MSCQKDIESPKVEFVDGEITNSRFYFNSKTTLANKIEELKKLDEQTLASHFENLYLDGFRSHTPIINPDNEALINQLSEEYLLNIDENQDLTFRSEDDDA